MSNYVFVIDTNKKPVGTVHPARARKLLSSQQAAVFRRYPFTIILKTAIPEDFQPRPLRVKLDPGAKTTGIAVLDNNKVVWAAELTHRGKQIRDRLISRSQVRRSRRIRKTRYRPARFLNRTRDKDWLAPSLESRVKNILTWVNRLRSISNITNISQELVRFDTQKLQNPEISGEEYQQGTLYQYEVREYLLEKWGRKCAYCGAKDVPLEVEHIIPRSKGGSNRVSNLTLACTPCNQAKGNQDIREFLKQKPKILNHILKQTKQPLVAAATVNTTRWSLFNRLKETGLPVEIGTGGQTKFNRSRQQLPKAHWIDAACVGGSTSNLVFVTNQPLQIKAKGHGTRQMCITDKYGFPKCHRARVQIRKGFRTGDIIRAVVTKGKKIGKYIGRVVCRASGSFDIVTKQGRVTDISYKYCKVIHKKDGYEYTF
jgi:5-methylcytosine-specific restriction endonuclease McrA